MLQFQKLICHVRQMKLSHLFSITTLNRLLTLIPLWTSPVSLAQNPTEPALNNFESLFHESAGIHQIPTYKHSSPVFENHPRYREAYIDVVHYDIGIRIDSWSSELHGKVEISFRAKKDGISFVTFDAVDLEIQDVHTPQGKSLFFKVKPGLLEIDLGRSLARDEVSNVTIEYRAPNSQSVFLSGPDASHKTRQKALYTYTQPEGTPLWVPCLDRPDDKATMTIKIIYPEGYKALSNGLLLSETPTQVIYSMYEPIATYLISLVVGPYDQVTLGEFEGKPLTLWSPRSVMPLALEETKNTLNMMRVFSNFTGVTYPFSHYAQSVAESYGGSMEHQTATTMGGTRISGDGSGESVVAHELAHQWFGDWVTCRTWGDLWLNEGFATYLPFAYYESLSEHTRTLGQLDAFRLSYFNEANLSPKPLSDPNVDVDSIFNSHAYEKGALVIHLMRSLAEKSGSSLTFSQVLKDYLTQNGRSHATSRDLQKSLESVTGLSWQIFFDQWVFSPGHPQVQASYQVDPQGSILLKVNQTQLAKKKWRTFTFPLEVEVIYDNGSTQKFTNNIYDLETEIQIPTNESNKVLALTINPRWTVPLEATLAQSLEAWIAVLKHSPHAASRLVALRELDRLKVFDLDQNWDTAAKAIALILSDQEPYLQIQGLQILLKKLPSTLPALDSSHLYQAVRQLISALKTLPQPNYQIKGAIAKAEEKLIVLGSPQDISRDVWESAYFQAKAVSERQAILGILCHHSKDQSVLFIKERLDEEQWSSQDRLHMIEKLMEIKSPESLEILGNILATTRSTMFSRPILNRALAENWQEPSLVKSMQQLAASHSNNYERSLALRWIASQKAGL